MARPQVVRQIQAEMAGDRADVHLVVSEAQAAVVVKDFDGDGNCTETGVHALREAPRSVEVGTSDWVTWTVVLDALDEDPGVVVAIGAHSWDRDTDDIGLIRVVDLMQVRDVDGHVSLAGRHS